MKKLYIYALFFFGTTYNMDENSLIRLVPRDIVDEKEQLLYPTISYTQAMQINTFQSMINDEVPFEKKDSCYQFSLPYCPLPTANNLVLLLTTENEDTKGFYSKKFTQSNLLSLLNVVNALEIPDLQKLLMHNLTKRVKNTTNLSEELQSLNPDLQNECLTQLLNNNYKALLEKNCEKAEIFPIDEKIKEHSACLGRNNAFTFHSEICYINKSTNFCVTAFNAQENNSSCVRSFSIATNNQTIPTFSRYGVYITTINTNTQETLLYVNYKEHNKSDQFIFNLQSNCFITIPSHCCFINNEPNAWYSIDHENKLCKTILNDPEDENHLIIDLSSICSTEIISIATDFSGDNIVVCTSTDMVLLNTETPDDYKTYNIHDLSWILPKDYESLNFSSAQLNTTGNKMLITAIIRTTVDSTQTITPLISLLNLHTDETTCVSLPEEIQSYNPSCEEIDTYLETRLSEDEEFIIVSASDKTLIQKESIYFYYHLPSGTSFSKKTSHHRLTPDGLSYTHLLHPITENSYSPYGEQKNVLTTMISPKTKEVLHLLNPSNQSIDEKYKLLESIAEQQETKHTTFQSLWNRIQKPVYITVTTVSVLMFAALMDYFKTLYIPS